MRHLTSIHDWTRAEVLDVLDLSDRLKAHPRRYGDALHRKVLLMVFEKPSLRTRVSFEAGMTQLGGHAIHYDLSSSPLGAGKETVADMARVSSRYVDLIMARLFDHAVLEEMAAFATVPVINALTDRSHPCQILADLQTIREKKGRLEGLSIAYLGDAENNVTYSLMHGCAMMGMDIRVACPNDPEYRPLPDILASAQQVATTHGGAVLLTADPREAARGADVVYTDSWMSYHISKDREARRVAALQPFQVTAALMRLAAPDAIFMNCLPAIRGQEQTAEVIDGPWSVVFDEAENRLHAQKAVMLRLLEAAGSIAAVEVDADA